MKNLLKYSFIISFFLIEINVLAQTPKPTKAFTIKYIVEKLNESCVGVIMEVGQTYETMHHYTAYHYKEYSIVEKNGTAYIIVKQLYEFKKTDYSGNDDFDRFFEDFIEIPVSKIVDIQFITQEKQVTKDEYQSQIVKDGYRGMIFYTKGDNIIFLEIEKDKTTHFPVMIIPSFDLENEPKLKKAILNLQSYYKQEADPFAN